MAYTIDAGGESRILSLLPRTCGPGEGYSGILGEGNAPTLIDSKDWVDVDLGHHVDEIMDQDGHSTCWSYGTTQAHQILLSLCGMKDVRLSASTLVGMVNGGRDDGATVQDAIRGILQYGQVPDSLVPDDKYNPKSWPANWQEIASYYRMVKIWDAQNNLCFETLVTGLQRMQPGILGTNAFGGGHLVAVAKYTRENGVDYLWGPNSWGLKYSNCGIPGWWKFARKQLTGLGMFGVGVFQAGVVNPNDLPPIPSM